MNNEDKTFLGTGWGFPPRFSTSGYGVEMVSANRDIQESLRILLSTVPGERIMRPDYGCGIQKLVFEPVSQSLLTKIQDMVRRAVLFFESRIKLLEVLVETDPHVEGTIFITLEYKIRQTNTRQNMVYPFYLKEGTNTSSTK